MGWRLALALVSILALCAVGGLAVYHLMAGRVAAAQAQTEHALDDGEARKLEIIGADRVKAVAAAGAAKMTVQRNAAHVLDDQAAHDADAQSELPPSVLGRIRAGDQRLCASGNVDCGAAPADGS